MCSVRSLVTLVLALALVASAAVHGARAAGMAMPVGMACGAAAAEPCDLCGHAGAEAAAQCALVCAGLTGVIGDAALLRGDPGGGPRAASPAASASRFAGPEPDPPR